MKTRGCRGKRGRGQRGRGQKGRGGGRREGGGTCGVELAAALVSVARAVLAVDEDLGARRRRRSRDRDVYA
eukprot:1768814-Rhodomonas_salina.1